MKVFLLVFSVLFLFGFSLGNKCTNTLQFPTNALKYEFFSSKNVTLVEEMIYRYHLTDDMVLREENELLWKMADEKMMQTSGFKLDGVLKEVPLHDVRLDANSVHGQAQETNLNYLLLLDVDRLVWSFKQMADLPTPGKPYGGWEAPLWDLRGHFVGNTDVLNLYCLQLLNIISFTIEFLGFLKGTT